MENPLQSNGTVAFFTKRNPGIIFTDPILCETQYNERLLCLNHCTRKTLRLFFVRCLFLPWQVFLSLCQESFCKLQRPIMKYKQSLQSIFLHLYPSLCNCFYKNNQVESRMHWVFYSVNSRFLVIY